MVLDGFGTTYLHKLQWLAMALHSFNPTMNWLDSFIGPTTQSPTIVDWSDYLIYPLVLLLVASHFQIYGWGLRYVISSDEKY